jgi:hypothetical protein
MDLYTFSLVLGAAGLGVMALSGLGSHFHVGGHGGHGGHAGHAHTHAGGHAIGARAGHRGGDRGGHARGRGDARWSLVSLLSPRLLFSVLLGFGATGLLARHVLGGPLLVLAAVVGGIAFEALAAGPISRFFFRFASKPALTLESCLQDEARAISGFDAQGNGMVSIELDGQRVQVLATLSPEDLAAGVRVRSGDLLRVQDVDAARNRCTVSVLGL